MKTEYLEYTDQDYQNIAQCFRESRCDGTAARLLYASRYGVEISAEDVQQAIDLYEDVQTLWRDTTHPNPEESIGTNFEHVIKKEIIDPEEEAVIENENVMYVIKGVFNKIPIVYTTKLDDMLIFQKDFWNLDTDDIVENIIIESKVKFKKLPVKTKNILNIQMNPFFKLVENIRRFNELTNTKICDNVNVEESTVINKLCLDEKSLKLLKKCTPLSVVLVDYRKESTPSSLVPKVKSKITTVTKESIKLMKSEYNSLIFLNNFSNSTEIYYLNDLLIASYYISLGHVHYSNFSLHSIIMDNCCWVARENCINNLNGWPKNHVGRKTAAIMKIPHQCPLGKCSCCCKNRHTILENNFSEIKAKQGNVSSDQINKSDTPIWLKNLSSITSNKQENYIINKALSYKRSKPTGNTNKIYDRPKHASRHIRLNNKNTIEIFSGGFQSVMHYIEVKNADETKVLPRLVETLSITNRKDVCCWCARDKLLCTQRSLFSQSEINMMRTPHTCPVDDCKCCCKTLRTETTTTYGPKDSSLVKNLIFAKKYNNKTFQRRKKLLKVKEKNYSDNTCHSINQKNVLERNYSIGYQHVNTMVKTHAYLNKTPTSTVLIPPAPPAITSPFISKTTNPTLPQMLVVPSTFTPSTSNQMVAQMPGISVPGIVQPGNDDPAVNTLVQSILERFRDVRLIMTPEGEVSAELNTPMENLSTAELKILSAILAHAKEQVRCALKLNPGVPNTMINMSCSIPGMSVTPLPYVVLPTAPAVTPIPGIPCTPVIESVVSNAPVTSIVPGIPCTPVIESVCSKAPITSIVPGIPCTPVIESVYSKAPVTSIVRGTPGTKLIPIAPKSPFASGITGISPTPVINSATLQARPVPNFLKSSLNSSIPATNSSVSTDVINKTVSSRTNVYQCYTNITALKSKEYISSCQNFMKNKVNVVIPKIDNVFSLKDHNIFDEAPQAAVPTATAIDPAIPGPSGIKRKFQGVHADDVANSKKHRPIILRQQSCETERGTLPVLNKPNSIPNSSYQTVSNQFLAVNTPLVQGIQSAPSVTPVAPSVNMANQSPFLVAPPFGGGSMPNLVPFSQPQVPVVFPEEEQSSPPTKVEEECILGF